jgi:cell division protease FtsH
MRIYLVLCGFILVLFVSSLYNRTPQAPETTVAFSDFLDQVEADAVPEVTIQGAYIHYRTLRVSGLKTYAPSDSDLITPLRAKGVRIVVEPEDPVPWWIILAEYFPFMAVLGFWILYNERRTGYARG